MPDNFSTSLDFEEMCAIAIIYFLITSLIFLLIPIETAYNSSTNKLLCLLED
jgi:hypothetical protein